MKKERFLVASCLLVASCFIFPSLSAQDSDSTYQLVQTIETDASFFTTNRLQQTFLINAENEVIKLNAVGQEMFRFSNNTLGELSFLDASNPFNILLYYPEYQNIITLDRTLNPTGQINLFNLNLLQIKGVGMSKDNRIWVFDNLNNQLKKVDTNGEVIMQSDDMRLILGKSIQANFLMERQQQVFVNDPNIGILVFDDFGQYIKTIDFKGLDQFQVLDNQLLFIESGKLKAFNLQSLLIKNIVLPVKIERLNQLQLQKNKLYFLNEGALKVYVF